MDYKADDWINFTQLFERWGILPNDFVKYFIETGVPAYIFLNGELYNITNPDLLSFAIFKLKDIEILEQANDNLVDNFSRDDIEIVKQLLDIKPDVNSIFKSICLSLENDIDEASPNDNNENNMCCDIFEDNINSQQNIKNLHVEQCQQAVVGNLDKRTETSYKLIIAVLLNKLGYYPPKTAKDGGKSTAKIIFELAKKSVEEGGLGIELTEKTINKHIGNLEQTVAKKIGWQEKKAMR